MNKNGIKILFLALCLFGMIYFISPAYADTLNSDLAGKIRIAILPLSVPESRTDLKQYGVGTMDTLITALSNIPDFIMVERAQIEYVLKEQAFQDTGYVNKETAVKIGQILGAQVLVTGNIQAVGEKIRITSHFTQVQTGAIIQTAIVTGKLDEIFDLQDELAKRLISSQKIDVSPERMEWVSNITKSTKSLEAYGYYLKGREEYLKLTKAGYEKAIEWYQKAVKADSEYALGYAGLGEVYAIIATLARFDHNKNKAIFYYGLAKKNIDMALILNPNSSEVYKALGKYYYSIFEGFESIKKIEETLKKALEINPSDSEIYVDLWLSNPFNDTNHPYIKKALELNPDSVYAHYKLALRYQLMQKWDLAYKELQMVLKINPDYERAKEDLKDVLKHYKP